ncbi:RluA family pseudouridine synthase [Geothrix sp.]|jgi:23S rRNA pseudouridine1911/1915/1917 synthase|uniref:RluA family pseudouridine synthase n=1 Tax=Geothrix sp. TaxID=1962974 RepID=UPI0025BD6289|nr:RluA family pseudouridine synthase [Geothrix sp.]
MARKNQGVVHWELIGPRGAGLSLLAHLSARYPIASPADWLERILGGQVRLDDDEHPSPEALLRLGQRVAWARPPWIEPEVPLATAILFEDEDLLAVAKPSGLPTLPGGGQFQEHTLLTLVRRRAPEASPMHRLGRGTSGLVLFARTTAARKPLQAAFQDHRTRKIYRALCQGHPALDAFEVAAPIGEVPYGPLGALHAAHAGGRASLSRVTVLERRAEATLVDVEITTGRPHQIRIHLAWAGHPLMGDPLYGPGGLPLPETQALPGDPGYLLHAHRLELEHPRTGAWLTLECQPPPALRST